MMIKMFKSLGIAVVAALLALPIHAAQLSEGPSRRSAAAEVTTLSRITGALADYKAFRLTSNQLHKIIGPECTRTVNEADEAGIFFEYTCTPASKISQIKLNSIEGVAGSENHLVYAIVFFKADQYSIVKAQMENKLGRPAKGGRTYAHWVYKADKELNAHGTPAIHVSADGSGDATLQIALEQGP